MRQGSGVILTLNLVATRLRVRQSHTTRKRYIANISSFMRLVFCGNDGKVYDFTTLPQNRHAYG